MDTVDLSRLLLPVVLILPWLLLCLTAASRITPWLRRCLVVPPAVCLLLALSAPAAPLELPGLLLGSQFGVDGVNRVFLAVTALAWLAASVLAVSFLGTAVRPRRFLACFVLAMGGNFALVLSQDAVSFFTGFALMSLAAYGLVNHRGDTASTYAGRVYIVLAITGEVLLFAALIGLVHGVGQFQFPLRFDAPPADWAIACAVLGFGVKAGMLPLHMSIPLSYGAAPLAGGVALAGAMLNAGLLGWLRWLPLGSFELGDWGLFFAGAGLLGVVWGVVQGVRQASPTALLGYSSISQVGLMMLFIGAGFLAPGQWPLFLPLLGYFVLHHAIAKTALFCASSGHLPAVGPRWLWWLVFSLPGLALIGVPLSTGSLAKAGLVEVVTSPGVGLVSLAPWLTLATAGTAVLMARWLYLAIRAGQSREVLAPAPWVALALAALVALGPLLAMLFGVPVPAVGEALSAAG
ncbi:MAG: proton-conducting transporter membrane subunit [Halieaceae bacterium]|jgi:multicomponent Na+:H+ antiporter subunit D|nr:proton-conducting transporter membrane subunit [Halieaceae bacterium]